MGNFFLCNEKHMLRRMQIFFFHFFKNMEITTRFEAVKFKVV